MIFGQLWIRVFFTYWVFCCPQWTRKIGLGSNYLSGSCYMVIFLAISLRTETDTFFGKSGGKYLPRCPRHSHHLIFSPNFYSLPTHLCTLQFHVSNYEFFSQLTYNPISLLIHPIIAYFRSYYYYSHAECVCTYTDRQLHFSS